MKIEELIERELKSMKNSSTETKENLIKRFREGIEESGKEWTPELESKIRQIVFNSN